MLSSTETHNKRKIVFSSLETVWCFGMAHSRIFLSENLQQTWPSSEAEEGKKNYLKIFFQISSHTARLSLFSHLRLPSRGKRRRMMQTHSNHRSRKNLQESRWKTGSVEDNNISGNLGQVWTRIGVPSLTSHLSMLQPKYMLRYMLANVYDSGESTFSPYKYLEALCAAALHEFPRSAPLLALQRPPQVLFVTEFILLFSQEKNLESWEKIPHFENLFLMCAVACLDASISLFFVPASSSFCVPCEPPLSASSSS